MSTTRKRTAQPQPLPSPAATAPAAASPSPSSSPTLSSPAKPANGMSHADRAMAAMLRLAEERHGAEAAMEDDEEREDRRDSVVDRRTGIDRRDMHEFADGAREDGAASTSTSTSTNLERRRGPGRRRTDFMKCADEGEMTQEQFLFIMAIDAFKRVNGKTFPTWTDVLEVVRKLGYRKTMPSELNLGKNTEDWSEPANAPAGVFKEAEED